ncbi:hypothetical protein ABH973_000920 [Bradyrhizobium ottawaense]
MSDKSRRIERLDIQLFGLSPSPFLGACGRAREQIGGLNTKAAREPIDNVDTCRINASLECADVSAVDFSTMSQFLL